MSVEDKIPVGFVEKTKGVVRPGDMIYDAEGDCYFVSPGVYHGLSVSCMAGVASPAPAGATSASCAGA